jgi:UDP-N-acetylglucosamine 4,6-dehydratase
MIDLSGKILLITGGTGSFGNAVLERYLNSNIEEIRIFSRDEKKQYDMRQRYRSSKVKFCIGDVRDPSSVNAAVAGVDMVFHAAALKQVPSCEFYPLEAVKTNVFGTENVLEASIRHQVSRVVVLSTDKAVYPINAMGMTKALMEKLAVAKGRSVHDGMPIICITRYGNVMASRGSVIPLFIEQVLAGGPLTVTDREMTRFMMLLDEAVDLVEYSFSNGFQGDLFVRKAPACTIGELAQAICELFENQVPIRVIGTRHGEKLYETLVNREEMAKAVDEGDYYRISADTRDLNYEQYFTAGEERISHQEEYTSHNTKRLTLDEVKFLLNRIPGVQTALETRSVNGSVWSA